MMDNIGDVIASSKFMYDGVETIIDIYKPRIAISDSDEFACAFSIHGGVTYAADLIGFDATQSLILCLRFIGEVLENSEIFDKSLIKWAGGNIDFLILK